MASHPDDSPNTSAQSTSTSLTTPEGNVSVVDDFWGDGDTSGHSQEDHSRETLSDLPTLRRRHMTDGYREGLGIGKAKVMQSGFDAGYPVGVKIALRAGKILGVLEGLAASKGISVEEHSKLESLLNDAKNELAVSRILQGISDSEVMENGMIEVRAESVLSKWENVVLGY